MTEFKAEARFEDVKAVHTSTTAATSGSARPNCREIRVYRHQRAQPGVSGLSTRNRTTRYEHRRGGTQARRWHNWAVRYPADHVGLEILPPDECLRLLASVPVGRVGFVADGEVVVLPVNHVVDGQDVIFRTAHGSKLSAAEGQNRAAFEADHYNEQTQAWWSVLVNGRAEVVNAAADIERLSLSLSRLGVYPWVTAVRHPFWIRIRPTSVSGRRTPGTSWASQPAGTLSQPPDAVD